MPLVLLGEVDGHRVAYFTFDITRSNLPVQVGFPIMGTRILEWLGGASAGATDTAPAGTPIPISPPAGATTEVTRDGEVVAELADPVLSFDDTGTPGVYRVSYVVDGTRTDGPVAVRSFDRQESVAGSRDIAVLAAESVTSGEGSIIREWAPSVVAATIAIVLFGAAATPLPTHAATGETAPHPASVLAFDQKLQGSDIVIDYMRLPADGYVAVYGTDKSGMPTGKHTAQKMIAAAASCPSTSTPAR